MPFLTLGTVDQLQIKVPTKSTTSWADTLKTDTFQKISEHDHTGSGKGTKLGTGSLQDNAVTGIKFRLANNQYLRARNAAGDGDIDVLRINASDKLEISFAELQAQGAATLADNQSSATTAAIVSLTSNQSCKIEMKLVRGADVQRSILFLEQSNSTINRLNLGGDDVGVTFSINAGVLEYTTTSTGNTVAVTYTLVKE